MDTMKHLVIRFFPDLSQYDKEMYYKIRDLNRMGTLKTLFSSLRNNEVAIKDSRAKKLFEFVISDDTYQDFREERDRECYSNWKKWICAVVGRYVNGNEVNK